MFTPTYQDTNSVGNIYWAMYAMWVGKTRELMFDYCMPEFDPATSPFLILTKSFQHKFLREIKEFMPVTIHIKVKSFNRKFVTLEHKILDENQNVIGKGEQDLMFVASASYKLIDIPEEVLTAFLPFTA
jgi:acyl-CoA thioesterase FadM